MGTPSLIRGSFFRIAQTDPLAKYSTKARLLSEPLAEIVEAPLLSVATALTVVIRPELAGRPNPNRKGWSRISSQSNVAPA